MPNIIKPEYLKLLTRETRSYNFIVLSERAKQSEATGDRFEEAKNINKSLMTLGSVIKGIFV